MIKKLLLIAAIIGVGCMSGCAVQGKKAFQPVNLSPKLQSGQYIQKTDNFLVIIDASSTMADPYKEKRKLTLAKDIVSNMHRTIPQELKLKGALRVVGNTISPFTSRTDLPYSFAEYSLTKNLDEGLKIVKRASGQTPLGLSIAAAADDLKSVDGRTAVIIVSDGMSDDDAVGAATGMKRQFGDNVAIYPILIGDDPKGQKNMEKIARAGVSGFSETGDKLLTPEEIADYVEKVFLAKVTDSDGDGVPDTKDKCPNTPVGIKVDENGCPVDSDGDGVTDDRDQCPDTPAGTRVDDRGCPIEEELPAPRPVVENCLEAPKGLKDVKIDDRGCWILENVLFDSGKWKIKSKYYAQLDALAKTLKKNPDLQIMIQGHTDNIGSAEYNQGLSERRAHAVMLYLKKKGVEPKRLSTVGYGFKNPIASNETKKDRAKNRRVQLEPMKVINP
jgi:OOP family OmpA-OmpF porin